MPNIVAIDTGLIVALFDRRDKHHLLAVQFVAGLKHRGFVTGGVIAEVMWLLDFRLDAQLDFLTWIRRDAVDVVMEQSEDWNRIGELMAKYSDLPMDYADAAVCAACERQDTRLIATLDSDFDVYRFRNRQRYENVFVR